MLAWTGVLDGKRAVTHWRYCPRLADGFSRISVEPNAIFVKDGRVWTSAGVSAGIDLALAMIEEDFGHITALDVARRLVVFLKRPGGQSQFSTVLAAQASDVEGRFSALHAWIIENIAGDLKVEALAQKAGMTPRTFARAYVSRTGMTPASGVEALRVKPRGCCSKARNPAVWSRWRSGQGSATTNACGGLRGTSGYLLRNTEAVFRVERQSGWIAAGPGHPRPLNPTSKAASATSAMLWSSAPTCRFAACAGRVLNARALLDKRKRAGDGQKRIAVAAAAAAGRHVLTLLQGVKAAALHMG